MTHDNGAYDKPNLNAVLVRQLGALTRRVAIRGHGTPEGAAIDTIQQLWDLGWDIVPRLDQLNKRETERRGAR